MHNAIDGMRDKLMQEIIEIVKADAPPMVRMELITLRVEKCRAISRIHQSFDPGSSRGELSSPSSRGTPQTIYDG